MDANKMTTGFQQVLSLNTSGIFFFLNTMSGRRMRYSGLGCVLGWTIRIRGLKQVSFLTVKSGKNLKVT